MNIEQKKGSTVFKRTSDYEPRKNWRNYLIGRPLQTADAPHQMIGRFLDLAVFSSDVLSSVAYGPQEVILILAAAGIGSFHSQGYRYPGSTLSGKLKKKRML